MEGEWLPTDEEGQYEVVCGGAIYDRFRDLASARRYAAELNDPAHWQQVQRLIGTDVTVEQRGVAKVWQLQRDEYRHEFWVEVE